MMKTGPPSELILFVTSRCHLRCRHCFNWENLQRNRDLSKEEIEALAKSIPALKTLDISGGEPFLRNDLVDICRVFAHNCRIDMIDIPTSGTLVDTTLASVKELLKIKPSFNLSIGISIDGMEAYHDSNRGVPGTFSKAVECGTELLKLKEKSKKLSVNILTTLVRGNKEELLALKRFVAEHLPGIDNLSWGIARGEMREGNLGLVSPDDLACIDGEYIAFAVRNKKARQRAVAGRFYELRREAFLKNTQPVPCVAGNRIAVVYDDGSVAPCELLPPVGNLRDAPFEKIWNSRQMTEARAGIASGKCACTHECFLAPSFDEFLLHSPMTIVRLNGIYGLYQILYAKCGLGTMARAARKIAGRS
jgi:MoaA/NifB/PqqE/SkfB family radical SAM enzyme